MSKGSTKIPEVGLNKPKTIEEETLLYIGVAVGLNVLVLAGVVWYYVGQIQNVIHDQRLESDPVPLYPWALIRNCLITPLIAYYLSAFAWLVIAVTNDGLWNQINKYFDSIGFSLGGLAPAGVVLVLLVLLAVLPAIACSWLEDWLERSYKNTNRDTEERSWRTTANLTVVS